MQPGRHKSRRTISARHGGVNWKIGKLTGSSGWGLVNPRNPMPAGSSAAGHAHMAADARAVVPAIDDEVVALRLQADGAVDRRS